MPSKLVSFQSPATNAAIESFLDTLKAEYFHNQQPPLVAPPGDSALP